MASPHYKIKVGKAGRSMKHAAYIARLGEYGKHASRREELIASDTGNMPAWAQQNPMLFWQAADAYERSNGSTYREFEVSLPRELNPEQRRALLDDFIRQELGDRHAYQWAIHNPKAADGGEQPHVHLMFSERKVDGVERDPEQYFKRYNAKFPERGGCKKGFDMAIGTRTQRREQLKVLRNRWGKLCNNHLEKAGLDVRIDMRSHAERKTGLLPEKKQLPSAWRKESTRANIVEFRQARHEQAEARVALKKVIPDTKTEIISLQQKRQQLFAKNKEITEQRKVALADLDKLYDKRVTDIQKDGLLNKRQKRELISQFSDQKQAVRDSIFTQYAIVKDEATITPKQKAKSEQWDKMGDLRELYNTRKKEIKDNHRLNPTTKRDAYARLKKEFASERLKITESPDWKAAMEKPEQVKKQYRQAVEQEKKVIDNRVYKMQKKLQGRLYHFEDEKITHESKKPGKFWSRISNAMEVWESKKAEIEKSITVVKNRFTRLYSFVGMNLDKTAEQRVAWHNPELAAINDLARETLQKPPQNTVAVTSVQKKPEIINIDELKQLLKQRKEQQGQTATTQTTRPRGGDGR
jgi:MobA/MobL family.